MPTYLSPELVPFFLSSIQPQFAVGPLLLFFSLVLQIFVGRKIDCLVQPLLYERCGRISASPPASTAASSVPAALPSFVVRAACRRPVLILRSASSTSYGGRPPCVCTKASAPASCEG